MGQFENHPLHPGEGLPYFISAGVLKTPAQLVPFMEMDPLTAPVLTIGGFTWPEWAGNAKGGEDDFVYYPDLQMAGNARGLPNPGKDGILALRDPIKRLTDIGIKTIIQVTNLPHERAVEVIPKTAAVAASVNPTAVEVNLSCPNGLDEDGNLHPPLSSNADASGEVMEATRKEVGPEVTLGAKDSPHVRSVTENVNEQEVSALVRAIELYIDLLSGINTIGGQPFPELKCAGEKGGMSGPVVARIARQHLSLWRRLAPNIPYLSTGGIDSQNAKEEAAWRLKEGALLVGGAQEFYRTKSPANLALRWAVEIA